MTPYAWFARCAEECGWKLVRKDKARYNDGNGDYEAQVVIHADGWTQSDVCGASAAYAAARFMDRFKTGLALINAGIVMEDGSPGWWRWTNGLKQNADDFRYSVFQSTPGLTTG